MVRAKDVPQRLLVVDGGHHVGGAAHVALDQRQVLRAVDLGAEAVRCKGAEPAQPPAPGASMSHRTVLQSMNASHLKQA